MRATQPRLLFIDVDGVLHDRDAHFAVDDVLSAGAEELRAVGLFVHCQLLAEHLAAHPDVELVVHSSWRITHGLEALRNLLGPAGARLVAITSPELEREASVLAFLRRRRLDPAHIVIMDDQPELFSALRTRVIACDGQVGLSSPDVLRELHAALLGREPERLP